MWVLPLKKYKETWNIVFLTNLQKSLYWVRVCGLLVASIGLKWNIWEYKLTEAINVILLRACSNKEKQVIINKFVPYNRINAWCSHQTSMHILYRFDLLRGNKYYIEAFFHTSRLWNHLEYNKIHQSPLKTKYQLVCIYFVNPKFR